MNPRKNPIVQHANNGSLPRWNFSTMSGTGIAGVEIHIFRFPERNGVQLRGKDGFWLMVRHSTYGVTVPDRGDAEAIGFRDGVLFRYGRNTCRFVMSRAARRRGVRTDDRAYLETVQRYAARRPAAA